jgi:hypothetical protein
MKFSISMGRAIECVLSAFCHTHLIALFPLRFLQQMRWYWKVCHAR